jgi:hypothetical protein
VGPDIALQGKNTDFGNIEKSILTEKVKKQTAVKNVVISTFTIIVNNQKM